MLWLLILIFSIINIDRYGSLQTLGESPVISVNINDSCDQKVQDSLA